MNRYTFVIQVHPEGISTLENLSTQERIRISEMDAVAPQIERWLAALGGESAPRPGPGARSESSDGT